MSVTYDKNGLSTEQILQLVDDMGYDAAVWETTTVQDEESSSSPEERTVQIRFEGLVSRFVITNTIYFDADSVHIVRVMQS